MRMRIAIARGSAYSGTPHEQASLGKTRIDTEDQANVLQVEQCKHSSWIDINQDDQHMK